MLIVTGILVIYFLLLVFFLLGWKQALLEKEEVMRGREPLISVVVAVRNEAKTIGNLLMSLDEQDYKAFEVIVVNDDSEDETMWVVSHFDLKNLRVLPNRGAGKKAALSTGIQASRGSIIATTDADCAVPPGWLKLIRAAFRDSKVMMAFGGVSMKGGDSFFDSLQEMEFSSLIAAGAATAALGFPSLCNGANLAFRKKVFSLVKGYQDNLHIPSGDDEFLLRKINKQFPGSIHFLSSRDSVVKTHTQPDVHSFFQQRLRWASKWRYNSSLFSRALAVAVVSFQIAFMVNWAMLFSAAVLPALFLICVKMILEAAFLLQACRFLGNRWNWLAFFSLQFLYPLYVVAVAGASFLMPFQWKNRIFKPRGNPTG